MTKHLGLSLVVVWGLGSLPARASQVLPPEVAQVMTEIDRAASSQNLERVMRHYSEDFSNSDGQTKAALKTGLQKLWAKYSDLSYKTEVTNWQKVGNQYLVEAVTKIEGKQKQAKFKPFKLSAQLTAKQTYQTQTGRLQILRQEIVQETSLLTAGDRPPKLDLRLPNVIGLGRQYTVDAIADTPEYNIMVGAIFAEPVTSNSFLMDKTVDLEPLRSGGIFKIGQAPYKEGNYWVSAVIVREGGISIAGQRLQVSKDQVGDQYKPAPDLPVRSLIRPSIRRAPAS
ncbi:MAG: hypothetical protein SFT94_00320 [Pseudanabaenaceae cyanobacterium bins.68]|nr:hypothetical protein [Pseudanabaenaceae cyanobacterium bins.68]